MRTKRLWLVGALLAGAVVLGAAQEETLQVVIHAFGQGRAGNGEWVELLVVGTGPGSTVDLRGWVFRDHQGLDRGGVYLTFTDHPLWAEVRAGTLVVFYNAGDRPNLPPHFPDDDVDPADFVLVLPAVTGDYFVLAQWAGLGNTGDSLVLLDAEGRLVDGLSYADRSGQLPQIPNVGRGQAAGYVGTSVVGVNDPALWVVGPDAPGGSNPGAPNSEENRAWIEQLRSAAQE
ncbi:MAG: hypothetical protein BIP78_1632 [Candidatus Bipolaricaulis sibiricus]|uniref:LTD domain-containing protein n=1 Tax=Bipolaricaulis sibiricus TaxID=2501609 RepID=A0A410FWF4_BIPS1|nr:MAG: hypothetical protein BIP78_1632 [Candidatus Bipolaricaulis sibiricus]